MTAATALFDDAVDTDRASERLTARALRRSLVPGNDPASIAEELAALAGHRRRPILRALLRMERARTERCPAVVERAELLLCAALERTVPASPRAAA
jgi:hypothetical protein